ncbi:AMP-binding protein [Actinomadura litoris]|uniref:AMP-binding protein n=1 Tax=Actinomadura litoris TaxID=2678616 RepID=UPI001FA73857|nr:AMP-binding protein [Actinomadura litoris]
MTDLHDAHDHRRRGWWRDGTFLDDLDRWAGAAPDRPAVVGHVWETGEAPDTVLTYAGLAARADRVAAGLAELGVRPGDRVAMQLVNQWQATVLALGCGRAGAVVVPYFIATGAADTEWILRESGARAAVSLDTVRGLDVAGTIAGMRDRLPALRHQIVVGEKLPEGAVGFDALLASDGPAPAHRPSGDDVFQIMYTSGTTGKPKGVRHSFNTLYAMARSYTVPLGLGEDDVLSTPCIVGGQGGWLYGMLAPLVAGATAVWADAFRPGDFLDLAERYGITAAYFTPLILDALVGEQRAHPRRHVLRHMVTGSTPIPPALPARFRETFGLPLRSLWGMTENGGVTISGADDPPDWAARSDGRPVEWMSLRLVDEGGAVVEDGPGRLEVRGANMCLGYEGAEELFAASVRDGWFDTGDLARPDGRGGIKVIGRTKDMINKGGVHVPAVAVEGVLREVPGVAEVAVVGEPEPLLGETVVAVVVASADGPPTLEDLRRRVREAEMTPGYEPDRLEVVAELPKTPTGKVRKRVLEEEFARRASASASQ